MKTESFVCAPLAAAGGRERTNSLLLTGPVPGGVLLGSVMLVIERRLAGALLAPLGAGAFLATAAALLLLAGWAATCWPDANNSRVKSSPRPALVRRGAASAMLVLALVGILALAVPGTSVLALGAATGAWLLTALALVARERFGRGWARGPDAARKQGTQRTLRRSTVEPAPRERSVPSIDELPGIGDDLQIVQHLVRRQTETSEQIEGWLRCDFSPGQRTAAAHVAFCPPLGALPTVEARIDSRHGAAATCKVAELYVHGARFDVRLASPAQQATAVRVVFSTVVAHPMITDLDPNVTNLAPDSALEN